MAESKYIQELIEGYFEGLTSLEEEKTLREYFQKEDIPEEWKIYQNIFQYFADEQSSLQAARNASQATPLRTVRPIPYIRYLWISAAACVLLFFVLKLTFPAPNSPQLLANSTMYMNGEKYSDIELIQTEALKALENLSGNRDDIYTSQVEALEFFFSND